MTCTLVNTPRLGGQWCGMFDVVMVFARGEEIIHGECARISGAGPIRYLV